MHFIGILIGELLALFFLSRILSKSLSTIFWRISHSHVGSVYALAFLFLPGVVIHELAHYLTANLLFVRTGEIEFIPQVRGESVKLGSVQIAQCDPFRRALIGVAPILVGFILLLAASFYFLFPTQQLVPAPWNIILLFYIVFEIGNTMFSSSKDVEGTVEFALALLLIGTAFFISGFRIPSSWITALFSDHTMEFLKQASILLLIPLGIDAVVIGLTKIVQRKPRS